MNETTTPETQVELGFHPLFLQSLVDEAVTVLYHTLPEPQKDLLTLVEAIQSLLLMQAKGQEIPAIMLESLPEDIGEMTYLIAELGGAFGNSNGIYKPTNGKAE